MRQFLKWRYGATLIASALFVVACSEATKNPVAPDDGPSAAPAGGPRFTTEQGDLGQCMGDDAVQYGGVPGFGTDPLDFNCTANDVRLANARTLSGDPIACTQGEQFQVDIVADIQQTATSERLDIGIWVAQAGTLTAEHGTCAFFYLPLGTDPAIENLDFNTKTGYPGDQCGDLEEAATITGFNLSQLTLTCNDPNNDGFLEVASCVSWTEPGGDRECSDATAAQTRAGTLPGNKSKCNCEPFLVPIRIQGSLTVVKQVVNDNGGTAGVSAFGINTDAGSLVFDAGTGTTTKTYTATTLPVDSGEYTLRESDIAGYTEGTWSCTGGGNLTNNTISAGLVIIDWNEQVTCTIINDDQPGTLTLVKNVVNDNGGTATVSTFNITTSAGTPVFGSAVVNGATSTYTSQAMSTNAGSKTLVEANVAGYTEGSWSCSPTAESSSTFSAGAVTVGNGVDVTCTITNDDAPGTLTLVKNVVNDNGGTAGVAAFNITTSAGTPVFGSAVVNGATSTYTSQAMSTSAGSKTLIESDVAGYTEGSWSCSPTAESSSTFSAGAVTVANGVDVTCTITNNDQPGTLTLVKNVVNDNGGTATVSTFNITTSAGTPVFGSAVVNGATSTYTSQAMSTNAGSKTLIEDNVAGYVEGSWSCSPTAESSSTFSAGAVTVGNGVDVTCTITNNDSPGSLTLVKNVVNDNGGTLGVAAFNITTSAGTPVFGSAVVNGATSTYTSQAMTTDAGSKTLIEDNVAGYTEGSWSCSPTAESSSTFSAGAVTVANGVDVTCTITNNDQPGTLTLVKNVVNDNGGTADVAAFNISTSAGTPVFGSAVVNGATSTYTSQAMTTNAGSKTLLEGDVTGYDEGSWSCSPTAESSSTFSAGSVTVGNGVDVTCTITNNDQPAKLIVRKVVIGDGGVAFDFTGTGSGVPSSFTITPPSNDIDSVVYDGIDAGTKTITEGNEDGYVLTDLGCSDQAPGTYNPATTRTVSTTIPNGGTVTCTYTNEQVVGQTTRTQGFWQTHLTVAWIVWNGGTIGGVTYDGVSDNLLCGRAIDSEAELMGAFWSSISQTYSPKGKRSALDQARMRLLQQLIAAELNHEAFGSGSVTDIQAAEDAFCGDNITAINAAASAMAAFNESGDEGEFSTGISANAKEAKTIADLNFWDDLPAGI